MLIGALGLIVVLAPVVWYFIKEQRRSTPSICWPQLAPVLKMQYAPNPPRLSGLWNGRPVALELAGQGARAAAALAKPTSLRLEIGAKDVVAKRAGMLVPDPVDTGDADFAARLLARCSDKSAGVKIFEPTLRQRLLAQPSVEILGQGPSVAWLLPAAKDANTLEAVFDILCVLADELEAYPAHA